MKCPVRARVAVAGLPASQQEWLPSLSCVSCALSLVSPPGPPPSVAARLVRSVLSHTSADKHRPMPDCLQAQVTKSGKVLWCHHYEPSYIVISCSQLLTVKFSRWCWELTLHANFNDSSPDPSAPRLTNTRRGQASEPKMAANLALHSRKVQWTPL